VAAAAAGAAAAASVAGEAQEGSPEGLPDLAIKGIEEFNRGEFYECHEYLEEAWMQESRRVRFLYQGILQVGVGFYHQQNGNWRGATGLLRNGTTRLKEFEPVTLGIDVARLVRESERCLRELEELGRERVGEFDRSGVPKVEWAG
jgi:predicted metal-dependent hydrolase